MHFGSPFRHFFSSNARIFVSASFWASESWAIQQNQDPREYILSRRPYRQGAAQLLSRRLTGIAPILTRWSIFTCDARSILFAANTMGLLWALSWSESSTICSQSRPGAYRGVIAWLKARVFTMNLLLIPAPSRLAQRSFLDLQSFSVHCFLTASPSCRFRMPAIHIVISYD